MMASFTRMEELESASLNSSVPSMADLAPPSPSSDSSAVMILTPRQSGTSSTSHVAAYKQQQQQPIISISGNSRGQHKSRLMMMAAGCGESGRTSAAAGKAATSGSKGAVTSVIDRCPALGRHSAVGKLLRRSHARPGKNGARGFPLSVLHVLLCGALLIVAILLCIICETWWSSQQHVAEGEIATNGESRTTSSSTPSLKNQQQQHQHRSRQRPPGSHQSVDWREWERGHTTEMQFESSDYQPHSEEDREYHEELVNDVNTNPSSTWRATYNKFAMRAAHDGHTPGSDKEAMRQALAKNMEHNEWTKAQMFGDTEEHLRQLIDSRPKMPLPREFDARKHWPLCSSVHEVVNQGGCGSCWAMASTSVMSDRVCIHSNGSTQARLSAQDLIECCPHCGGCGGTMWALFSFVYWKEHGIVTGGPFGSFYGCKPYSKAANCGAPCHLDLHGSEYTSGGGFFSSLFEHFSNSNHNRNGKEVCWPLCQPLYATPYEDDLHKASSVYWLRPNAINSALYDSIMPDVERMLSRANLTWEEVLKLELLLNGPLMGCFVVYDEFQHYAGGIYQSRTSPHTNELYGHCAKLVGWGEEKQTERVGAEETEKPRSEVVERTNRYWIYMNTWGRQWGENGFFRVSMDELPEEAAAGLPLAVHLPTSPMITSATL